MACPGEVFHTCGKTCGNPKDSGLPSANRSKI
jgi:hypothetical protein